jgi:hypothetical protein
MTTSGGKAEEALCMRGNIVVISSWGQVDIEKDHLVGETGETQRVRAGEDCMIVEVADMKVSTTWKHEESGRKQEAGFCAAGHNMLCTKQEKTSGLKA